MKRVLILDANQRSALATTRSLGRHGVGVFTGDETPEALAGKSRYSSHYLAYPSPCDAPEAFVQQIQHYVEDRQIDILLPMTELTTELLLRAQSRFPRAELPFAELSVIDSLSNKSTLHRLAESLGVPVPETWYIDSLSDLPADLTLLPYPLILKPSKSWVKLDGRWQRVGVQIARDAENAQQIINSYPVFQSHPFMLQRHIQGIGQGVFTLYDKSKPLAFFSHRRLREKPPAGGVSVLSQSVPVDPTLLAHARTLLEAVAWHGVAMVEFKVSDDGVPYLMEINTRFWGSLQLAIDAGIDFPWLLYGLATGHPPAPVRSYKTGRRLRWLLGDLDNLYLTLRDRHQPVFVKLTALGRFLWPAPFRTRHEVNRWSDLGPFWWELRRYIRDLRVHRD